FVDSQCGQAGGSCEDCTALIPTSTCDVSVMPRTCTSQQTQCPAPYRACPASLETSSPTTQAVCSASEPHNASSRRASGAHTAACQSFFAFEKQQTPSCASCLSQFDFDFTELTGLTRCVAPFVDAACNHVTACVVDCTNTSCGKCVDSAAQQTCEQAVPS